MTCIAEVSEAQNTDLNCPNKMKVVRFIHTTTQKRKAYRFAAYDLNVIPLRKYFAIASYQTNTSSQQPVTW